MSCGSGPGEGFCLNMKIGSNIGIRMEGFYKVQVVDAHTYEVVKDYPLQKNLILNGGLNAVASQYLGNLNYYAIAGTGSRPNFITGSDNASIYRSTITQSNDNLVYLWESASFESGSLLDFTSSRYHTYTGSLQVGDVIQYLPTYSESMVLWVHEDGHLAQVNQTYSFDEPHSQSFVIWKTSQADLHGETKRAGGGIADSSHVNGACGSTISHSSVLMWRTYNFAEENTQKYYTEVGVSWYATSYKSSSFARALLPETVSVAPGYRLRMLHALHFEFSPTGVDYITASIGDWPQGGASFTYATQSIIQFFCSYVHTDGTKTGYGVMDPAGSAEGSPPTYYFGVFMSTASHSLVPWETDYWPPTVYDDRSYKSTVYYSDDEGLQNYTTNTFEREKTASWGLSYGNSTRLRTLGFGLYASNIYTSISTYKEGLGFCMLFDEDQVKIDTQELYLSWKWSWSRVLA